MHLNRRRRRQIGVAGGLVVATLLTGALAAGGGWLDATVQTGVYDFFIQVTPQAPQRHVTIVGIDDETIAAYGRWPLPRRAYVDALRALREARAAVIGFDVAFYDEAGRVEDEEALAREMREAGNVVLPMQGQGSAVLDREANAWRYEELVLPVPILRQAAAGLAAVNIAPDPDGRVRRVPLTIVSGEERYHSLPLVLASWKVPGATLSSVTSSEHAVFLPTEGGGRTIPAEQGVDMRVYFVAPPTTPLATQRSMATQPCSVRTQMCVVSLADLVARRIDRGLIANRVVLIGAHSAAALQDSYPVPTSEGSKMEGVEIWANATDTILSGRFPLLREELAPTLLWLLLVSVAGVALVLRFGIVGLFAALGVFVAYLLVAIGGFVIATGQPGVARVPSVAYVATAVPWWIAVLGYLFVEERFTVQRTQRAFGLAVTPEVARHILELEDSGQLALGGELREATVLFGDIRGFTTMSEDMRADVLMATLNRYFSGMVEIVQRYGGTVNKYNGDSVMVIWGAPIVARSHAHSAVRCALELQRFVREERRKGGPHIAFGFGINTGEVVAGFLGAQGRFEYTVIGDTVNVASRLTSSDIAKRDQVIASERTLSELGNDVEAVDLGSVHVKGRAEPVHCFQINRLGELVAPISAPPSSPREMARLAGAR